MAATVRLLETGDHERYDRFVAAHRESTVYHTRAWHALLERAFGYAPRVLVIWRGPEVAGVWPLALVRSRLGGRRLVSLPFSHQVTPLADEEGVRAALDAIERLASAERCRFVEIRSGQVPGIGSGWVATTSYVRTTMLLERHESDQLSRLRPNTRQQLLQGLRHPDLRVEQRDDDDALECLATLVAATRRRQGSLTYPRVFYRELRERLMRPGSARLDLAFAGARCIAGLVTLCHGGVAIYGYSASVDDAVTLRSRPINVLMWRGINWARERGALEFDFGTSLPDQQGLVRFKEGWGGRTSLLTYYVWSQPGRRARTVAQDDRVARLASHVLRRLPQPLFTRITPYLLKQLG